MAQEIINTGIAPNDGQGDPIRQAFDKCNNNFSQLFAVGPGGNSIQNGGSSVDIPVVNGNVLISVGATPNVARISTSGIQLTGQLSASGNVRGAYILGNGSQLTGITANYSNANVATFMANYGSNNISTTGNITGGFFTGNGAGLTGVIATGNVGSANQMANGTTSFNIPVADGNIIGNVNGTTNVYVFSNLGANINGYVNASGNVSGGNLTLVPGTGNAYVHDMFATGVVSATGNVRGDNINTAGLVTATGNISGGNLRTVGSVTATGNITGNFYSGNGRQLTGQGMSFRVTANSNVSYLINGSSSSNPTITLTRGQMYNFEVQATNHPFWVKTDPVIGTGNAYSTGVTNNGAGVGTVGFQVPFDAPGTLYYVCQIHPGMYGEFNIVDGTTIQNGNSNVKVYGNGNVTTSVAGTANVMVVDSTGVNVNGNITANNFIGGGAGTPTLTSATNLDLSAATAVRVTGGGTFRLPSLTAAQIANIVAVNGDMVYNTTVNKIQGYENGSWGNLI